MDYLTLAFDRPAEAWNEALPLGNGSMGAMSYGRLREEKIELNLDTLWSGTGRSKENKNTDVAEKVYVIHRRKEFRGAAVTVAKLREKENVIFVLEHQVKEIIGEQKVTGVVLEDAAVIDVNGVFVAYGAVPQTDLLKKFAVLDDSGYVRAGETGETALEGLYVAGDARTKKLRQVVTAVSDGANAATAVAEYLK